MILVTLNVASNMFMLSHFQTKDSARRKLIIGVFIFLQSEKEHSDWFPERSEFCHTDR